MDKKPYAEIPYSEFRLRIERAKELMKKYRLDGLLLFSQENINYYTGWRCTWFFNFLRGAIIPREGEPALIVPGLIYHAVKKYSYVEDVRMWEEGNPRSSGVRGVVRKIKEQKLNTKTIGLELGIGMYPNGATYSEIEAIKKGLPKAKFKDASKMIWEQRNIKTPWEIGVMRRLSGIVVNGYKKGLEYCKEGVTEKDVQTEIWRSFISDGVADTPMQGGVIIRSHSFGVKTPPYTGRATDYVLRKGDQLMLDGGPSYKGYHSDIQRQTCIGEPHDLVKKLHQLAIAGLEAAQEVLKPGTKAKELYIKPVKAMKKIDPSIQFPWKFMGHCIGLQIHEPFWLIREEETILKPGMVLSIEVPGYDIPEFRAMGSFPEDMFLITENGFENLTEGLSRELWIS
jgi:Xaa-Pro dipeptidase